MSSIALSFLNLSILVGILVYKLKKPTQDYVRNRHESMRAELNAVRDQLKTAQEKYEEFSTKFKALNSEVAILREQSQQDAIAMAQRITADGRRLAANIVSDARVSAETLLSDLKNDLYQELSAKVLSRSEEILRARLTSTDQARIQKEFSQQVEKFQ